jgi:hypothetical protein
VRSQWRKAASLPFRGRETAQTRRRLPVPKPACGYGWTGLLRLCAGGCPWRIWEPGCCVLDLRSWGDLPWRRLCLVGRRRRKAVGEEGRFWGFVIAGDGDFPYMRALRLHFAPHRGLDAGSDELGWSNAEAQAKLVELASFGRIPAEVEAWVSCGHSGIYIAADELCV